MFVIKFSVVSPSLALPSLAAFLETMKYVSITLLNITTSSHFSQLCTFPIIQLAISDSHATS